ncbi:MAG TPA: hypothetical protein VIN75_18345, partial [Burkholderiaceae bacterium]
GAAYAKALAMNRALQPPAVLAETVNLGNLARLQFRQGGRAEAEAGLRDAMTRREHVLGADYRDNGRGYDRAWLADILLARGRLDEARTVAADALAEALAVHPEASPDTAFALVVDARLAAASGDWRQAATRAAQAVAMDETLADEASERAIRARLQFGEILHRLGRDAEARSQLARALAAADAQAPAPPALVGHIAAELALVAASLGDARAAAGLRERAQAALAAIPAGRNAERDKVVQLLVQGRDIRRIATSGSARRPASG